MQLHVSMQEVSKLERMTLSIPDELKKRMDALPEVNWPEVIKKGILKRAHALERLRQRGEL